MTKVINLIAGPSAGKSTNALQLTGYLKNKSINVEYVPEYAKELVFEKNWDTFDDQLFIFSEQNRRILSLIDKVDFIITDGPILLTPIYLKHALKHFKNNRRAFERSVTKLVLQTYNMYDNYLFFISRNNRKFIQTGRIQNKEQSIEKDKEILAFIEKHNIGFMEVNNYKSIIATGIFNEYIKKESNVIRKS